MIGLTLVTLDFFIVNVALPDIQRQLQTSSGTVEWLVAGYGLTFAAFLIAGGQLASRIGHRRVLAIGIVVFAVASLACGLASSAELLIGARLLQGTGAALVSPTVITIIGTTYQADDRRRALGVYGVVLGLAAVCGQLIGGMLIKLDFFGLGWRSIFLINLPLAAVMLVLLPRTVPKSRATGRRRIDVIGLLLLGLFLGTLLLPLVEGRQYGWPLWCWLSLLVSAICLAGLIAQQRRLSAADGAPLFEPPAFSATTVRIGLVCMIIYVCNQAPLFLFLALFLQQGLAMSPITSGLTFSALAVGYLATSMRAPQLLHRFGRRVLFVAVGLLTGGYLLMAAVLLGADGNVYALIPALLIVGLGQGIGLNSLTPLIVSGTEIAHVGAVSAVLATVQQVGSAVGVAVIGLVFFGLIDHGFSVALAGVVLCLAALMLVMALLIRRLPSHTPDRVRG